MFNRSFLLTILLNTQVYIKRLKDLFIEEFETLTIIKKLKVVKINVEKI